MQFLSYDKSSGDVQILLLKIEELSILSATLQPDLLQDRFKRGQ